MPQKILIKRGLKQDIPDLDIGELGYTIDSKEVYIGSDIGNVIISQPYVNVKSFGAKGDGSVDDRASIQAAIDSIANTGGTVYLPSGYYTLGGTLRLYDNMTLKGEGSNTKLFLISGSNSNLIQNDDPARGNTNIRVMDVFLDGNRTNNTRPEPWVHPNNTNLVFANVKNGVISGVISKSAWKHGIDICAGYVPSGDAYATTPSLDCIIDNCEVYDCGDDNITTHYSERIRISNCYVHDSAGTFTENSNGIEIDEGSKDVVVTNCIAKKCYAGFQAKGHEPTPSAYNVSFTGCLAIDCYQGFSVGRHDCAIHAHNITIVGCKAIDCNHGVNCAYAHDVIVSGLIVENAERAIMSSSTNSAIYDGVIARRTKPATGDVPAIAISTITHNTTDSDVIVTNCQIINYPNTLGGVRVASPYARNIKLLNNRFENVSTAIRINCDDIIIDGNIVENCGRFVFAESDPIKNIVIRNNRVMACSQIAIRLYSGENYIIEGNHIEGTTTTGMLVSGGVVDDMRVVNNTFINNRGDGNMSFTSEITGLYVSGNIVRKGSSSPYSSVGIRIGPNVDRAIVILNDLRDAGTTNLIDDGLGTIKTPENYE